MKRLLVCLLLFVGVVLVSGCGDKPYHEPTHAPTSPWDDGY
ncbi:MAG: hypothetical protein VX346_19720 [Planctomycetota bacterium]|nr:hypothetical protein [Planctomycetota bacterium]